MKKTKKIISLLLTIQMLFACILVPSAMATDSVIESSVIGSESSEELSPMMARACSYVHYEVNEYFDNGYVKQVTVTTYYNGSAIDSYPVYYTESGSESMPTFHGCKCPMCR